MTTFSYRQPPVAVTFGAGCLAQIGDALKACGALRPLLVVSNSAREAAGRLEGLLGGMAVGRFDDVAAHVPGAATDALRARASEVGADALVALGGGSAIDLAKAASFETELQVVAIPTTYGGSELTPYAGRTVAREKTTVLWHAPRAIVYDPELTLAFPVRASAGSAMNALAHCCEALYAERAQPLALLAAQEALRRVPAALREVVREPANLAARTELLYGGYLGGIALAGSAMALHHRICHVLGGRYGIAHGDANAAVLPHVVAFNAASAPHAVDRMARALETHDVPAALFTLARNAGAPSSLSALGLERGELAAIADAALAKPLHNPRPVDTEILQALLEDIWRGTLRGTLEHA